MARVGARSAARAEMHRFLVVGVDPEHDVPRCVDEPEVALRIEADRMRAAGRAAGRSVDRRVVRLARVPELLRNPRDLALAEEAVAPRAHERAVARELDDRMRAAVE